MNKYAEELSEELEEYADILQDLASELQGERVEPMRVVSMQIHGERYYNRIEKLMHQYLEEEDKEETK